jgi:hypothetical protein
MNVPVVMAGYNLDECVQVTQPMFKNRFQDGEIQLLVIVNGNVAKPYHGLETSGKRSVDDLSGFQQREILFEIGWEPDLLVGHEMSRQVDGCLNRSLQVQDEDILHILIVQRLGMRSRHFRIEAILASRMSRSTMISSKARLPRWACVPV